MITDRLPETQENIDQVWLHRSEAPDYVSARILWFETALSFIGSSSVEKQLSHLKTVFQKEEAFKKWTMQPVLDHIKPKITEPQHAILSALVDAMNKANLEKLNDFAEWRDVKPEEID